MTYKQELQKEVKTSVDTYIERIKNIQWFHPKLDLKRKDIDEKIYKILKAFNINAGIEYRQLKNAKDGIMAAHTTREATWVSIFNNIHNTAVVSISEDFDLNFVYKITYTTVCDVINDFDWYSTDISNTINGTIPASLFLKKFNWSGVFSSIKNTAFNQIVDYEYKNSSGSYERTKFAKNCVKDYVTFALADILALNIKDYKEKYPNGNFINVIPLWEAGLYPIGMINGNFVVYVPAVNGEFPKELI
ncbi:MAG: hypothetical protein WA101_00625 [Minisyncoccia bacterium]